MTVSNPTIGPTSNDREDLPLLPYRWRSGAEDAAANLGFGRRLDQLSPEHWQLVLANLETRMRMRGVEMPRRWQLSLARQVGRQDA